MCLSKAKRLLVVSHLLCEAAEARLNSWPLIFVASFAECHKIAVKVADYRYIWYKVAIFKTKSSLYTAVYYIIKYA